MKNNLHLSKNFIVKLRMVHPLLQKKMSKSRSVNYAMKRCDYLYCWNEKEYLWKRGKFTVHRCACVPKTPINCRCSSSLLQHPVAQHVQEWVRPGELPSETETRASSLSLFWRENKLLFILKYILCLIFFLQIFWL